MADHSELLSQLVAIDSVNPDLVLVTLGAASRVVNETVVFVAG